jgi:arginine decarboxylase
MASARPVRRPRSVATTRTRTRPRSRPRHAGQRYTEAGALYGIPHWGKGFFHVDDEGDLVVRPTREPSRGVALKQIVDEVALRGIATPMVIRFPQILSAAVANLNDAFARAIDEYGYANVFRGVFPIKVNQKRVVVDHIVEAGRRYGYGLEAGSKPELLAAIAADLGPECLITCNGYKDDTFVRMALNAVRMKKKVVLILEKVSELERILDVAKARGVRPLIGMRAKLYARGSGKWAKSGGEAAKFGLTTPEMLETVKILKARKMLDCLVMLHFHIGSQITDIRKVKEAIREAGRVYAKLRAQGVPIQYLNLGGGLGVDYDGSKTAFDSSMNYSVQEYANDVVYTVKQICDEEKVPAPVLVTESGRAVTAYHSVFVTNVLDVADRIEEGKRVKVSPGDPTVLQELASIYETVNAKTLRESYHDALQYKEELFTLFNLGHLSLEDRSKGEVLFWNICEKIHRGLKSLKEVPEEFEDMETMLADKYVLNFSVFQSLPDIWAIDQLFPILPIHRLNERPTEFGTLADITCDSDGKIEKFIDLRDIKETLSLHTLKSGEPYYLGVCLMGAYQDVLGDLHNLFGEVNEVLVTVDEQGKAHIEDIRPGESCERVLEYMDYDRTGMLDAIGKQLRVAGRALKQDESRAIYREFEEVFPRYTYLER